VSAVDNNIAILPTKTKPKKLVFHGSDGQLWVHVFSSLNLLVWKFWCKFLFVIYS
jgi:hypothetical protein